MFRLKSISIIATGMLMVAVHAAAQAPASVESLIQRIQSPDAEVRAAAWQEAYAYGADAIAPLAQLLTAADPEIGKSAYAALENLATHAGSNDAKVSSNDVANELAKLLDVANSPQIRGVALRLLALVAGDAQVDAIAALLDEPALQEDARLTLDRVSGATATRALVTAFSVSPQPFQARLADTLGHRGDRLAVDALTAKLSATPDDATVPALMALARLGESPLDLPLAGLRAGVPDYESVYGHACLTAGGAREEMGKAKTARNLYLAALSPSMPAHIAAGGLEGLSRVGGARFVPAALAALEDPERRMAALSALQYASVKGLDNQLAKAFRSQSPPSKALLLRILAERKAPQLERLAAAAAADSDAEVRVAAGLAVGNRPADTDVIALLDSGTQYGREWLVESYLDFARDKQKGGAPEEARTAFELLVRSTATVAQKIAAFDGLAVVASSGSMPFMDEMVKPWYHEDVAAVTDPAVRLEEEAAASEPLASAGGKAYVAVVAAQPDRDAAIRELTFIVDNAKQSGVVSAAVQTLRAIGGNAAAKAQRLGFVAQWALLGPLPTSDGLSYGRDILDVSATAFSETIEYGGQAYRWRDVETEGLPAVLDLRKALGEGGGVAVYAHAVLPSTQETPVTLFIGSNDGCEVWLNGQRIHGNPGPRAFMLDQDRVAAALASGENHLLVKVLQIGGEWMLSVRMTDA